MMTGYADWHKRNIKKMNDYEKNKTIKEAEQVINLIKQNLNIKGVS